MKYPTKKTIHDDYFESLDDFLNRKHNIINKKGHCKSSPPTVIDKKDARNIVAIGDIHGDFNALLIALYKAEVIDLKGHWIGGDTKVVQVGDLLDKGGRGIPEEDIPNCKDDSEWRILLILEHLNIEAKKDKGAVLILLGNHEILNFLGDFTYTTAATLAYFGGMENRRDIFQRGGIIAQKIACMTNTVMRIGDWVFAHAGITPEIMEYYKNLKLDDINNDIRDFILNKVVFDGNANPNTKEYRIFKLIADEGGIVWTRRYGLEVDTDEKGVCKDLRKTLNIITGEKGGMVVGHTPQEGAIKGNCDGKLFRIDRGMSTGFGLKNNDDERVEILKIVNGIPFPENINITEIKNELKNKGLSTTGNKSTLKNRLLEALDENSVYVFVNKKSYKKYIKRKIEITKASLKHINGYLFKITNDELSILDDNICCFRKPINWNSIKIDDENVNSKLKKYTLFRYYNPIIDMKHNIGKILS